VGRDGLSLRKTTVQHDKDQVTFLTFNEKI
jgi:hypothetical protein